MAEIAVKNYRRVTNPPQVTNLPHKKLSKGGRNLPMRIVSWYFHVPDAHFSIRMGQHFADAIIDSCHGSGD